MADPVDELRIRDDPESSRYVATLDDAVAGVVEYRRVGERLILVHTQVEPSMEGRGIGSRLARAVLEDLRRSGLTARIECPFLRAYLARHPEFEDVVAA